MRLLTWIAASLILVTSVYADEEADIDSHAKNKAATGRSRRPHIGPGMAAPNMMVVSASFKTAVEKLGRNTSCEALFQSLNLTGLQALTRGIYQQPQSPKETALCGNSAAAVTGVGLSQVLICKRFYSLPPRSRAAVLIHEALHAAGLNEAPYDPHGMTSPEITKMVKQACSL